MAYIGKKGTTVVQGLLKIGKTRQGRSLGYHCDLTLHQKCSQKCSTACWCTSRHENV
jgi:hypothetical protein